MTADAATSAVAASAHNCIGNRGTAANEHPISLREAAARLGLSYRYVRDLARAGRLDAYRVGWTWLTTADAVASFKKAQRPRGRPRGPR